MSLFKYSLSLSIIFLSLTSFASFSDMECLSGSFSTEVRHKGQPFGMTENKLFLDKQGCVLTIEHEKLKFMKKKWIVDVCRGPVHIKEDAGNINVFKRDDGCIEKKGSDYCQAFKTIKEVIQDDGLIFADGEKENLSTDHGRIFCSFLLVRKYLGEGLVFSKDHDYEGVLFSKEKVQKKRATETAPAINVNDGPADF